MKKLMKALAFATVMCMLLSTAAFADNSAVMDDGAKSVTVNVATNVKSTPISIVVTPADPEGTAEEDKMTAEDINSGNILYINQDVTDANGDVTFKNVDTKGVNGVNVFLGYEGVGNSALKLVAETLQLEPGDTVTIAPVKLYQADVVGKDYEGIENTESDYGIGAVVELDLDIDEGRIIKDMIWSITYNETEKAFTKANTAAIEALNTLGGAVRLGIAMSAGSAAKEETPAVLTKVNVIVKTNDAEITEESEEKIIFTDANDEVLEEGYVAPAEPEEAE